MTEKPSCTITEKAADYLALIIKVAPQLKLRLSKKPTGERARQLCSCVT